LSLLGLLCPFRSIRAGLMFVVPGLVPTQLCHHEEHGAFGRV